LAIGFTEIYRRKNCRIGIDRYILNNAGIETAYGVVVVHKDEDLMQLSQNVTVGFSCSSC
jgi:hypothetical protein